MCGARGLCAVPCAHLTPDLMPDLTSTSGAARRAHSLGGVGLRGDRDEIVQLAEVARALQPLLEVRLQRALQLLLERGGGEIHGRHMGDMGEI